MSSLKITLLSKESKFPTKGSKYSAGFDLYSLNGGYIKPGEHHLVKTGIKTEIPVGYYGRIAPRSGLAYKHNIGVNAGVIDSDYRGEIGVILINHNQKKGFKFSKHDRIAQLIIEKIGLFEESPYEKNSEQEKTYIDTSQNYKNQNDSNRGKNGFGSTGY